MIGYFIFINGFINNFCYEGVINTIIAIFIGGKRGMKKKTILFGSMLAVFLMLMIPNISAVEYQTVLNENEQNLIERFKNTNLNLNELNEKKKYQNMDELINNNISHIFDILLWLFYVLFYGFYIIKSLLDGNYFGSLFGLIWFIISIFGLKETVNNPDGV